MVRLLAWDTPVGYLTVTKVGATRDVNGGSVVGAHVLPLQSRIGIRSTVWGKTLFPLCRLLRGAYQ